MSIFSFDTLRVDWKIITVPAFVLIFLVAVECSLRELYKRERLPYANLYGTQDFNQKIPNFSNHIENGAMPRTVILGNSIPLSAFKPSMINKALDLEVYNLSFGGTTFSLYREMDEKFLWPIMKPERVILAPTHVNFLPLHPHNVSTRRSMMRSYAMSLYKEPDYVAAPAYKITSSLLCFRYSGEFSRALMAWKSPFVEERKTFFREDGYLVRAATGKPQLLPKTPPKENLALRVSLSNPEWIAFDNLVNEFKDDGIDVMVVNTPYATLGDVQYGSSNIRKYRALLAAYCRLHGIPFLEGRDAFVNQEVGFQDSIHMADTGATEFTAWLLSQQSFTRFLKGLNLAGEAQRNELGRLAIQEENSGNPEAAAILLKGIYSKNPSAELEAGLLAMRLLLARCWDPETAALFGEEMLETHPNEELLWAMTMEALILTDNKERARELLPQALSAIPSASSAIMAFRDKLEQKP